MAIIRQCKDPEYPAMVSIPSPLYGFPRGTLGRNGNVPLAIVIHCVSDLGTYNKVCNPVGALSRPRGSDKASVHFGIGRQGAVQMYIDPDDTAWGFGPNLPPTATAPSYDLCNVPTWALTIVNANIPPDYYTIHIAVEQPKQRTYPTAPQDSIDCQCDSAFDNRLNPEQSRNLVQLVAKLAFEYNIPIDDAHVNWFQNIDPCEREECGCSPCLVQFLCAVDAYCEAPDFGGDGSFNNESTLTLVYGEDKFEQKRSQTPQSFLSQNLRWNTATAKLQILTAAGTWVDIPSV